LGFICDLVHRRRIANWKFPAALAGLFLMMSLPAAGQVGEQIGSYKSLVKTDHGVVIDAANAKVSLTVYAPEVVRVRIVKETFERDFSYAVIGQPAGNFSAVTETADEIDLTTSALKVVVARNPIRISFYSADGKLLNEDDAKLGVTWQGTEVSDYKKMFASEKFIGLGEKTGPIDKRGRAYTMWNTDHPAYRADDDPLYTSTPFYIGIHDNLTYGIFFDNTRKTVFDFGASSDNKFMFFGAPAGEMNYYFFGGKSVASVIEEYTALTGRMKMPPLWSLGYQQCRWSYYPDSEVLSIAHTFRQKKIPADVIYLDIHYMDGYKIFTWNKERFPNPKKMIDELHAMGFHLVTIVDPGIKIDSNYSSWNEGIQNDYFAKYPDGTYYTGEVWPGRCNFPDFTKPETRTWWGKSFAKLIEPGVDGFWNDMNEPATWGQHVPDVVQFNFDGETATMKETHNVYGLEMARSTFEGSMDLLGGKRPFVLTRAGYSGVQRYSAVWTGDNFSSDEHMLLAVRLVSSMGIAGIAFAGPDIAGFMGEATPELFQRWLSIGTFTPFLRNHKELQQKRAEPWMFGEDVEASARQSINLRYELLPYIYSTFYQATQTGMPVQRTLAITNTNDDHAFDWDYQNEYMFGDAILVAPVSSTEHFAKVYFPEGNWYRLSSGKEYEGKQSAIVEAPLDNLPVFIKGSSIVPEQDVVQYSGQQSSDTLSLYVFAGKAKNQFTYYEDDGTTYNYEKGTSYKRVIEFDPEKRSVRLDEVEGSYASKFHTIMLILHGFETVKDVSLDGKKLSMAAELPAKKLHAVVIPNSNSTMTVSWKEQ
jgi:alpha-glucosidase